MVVWKEDGSIYYNSLISSYVISNNFERKKGNDKILDLWVFIEKRDIEEYEGVHLG